MPESRTLLGRVYTVGDPVNVLTSYRTYGIRSYKARISGFTDGGYIKTTNKQGTQICHPMNVCVIPKTKNDEKSQKN